MQADPVESTPRCAWATHHNAHEGEECEQSGHVQWSGHPTATSQLFLGKERRSNIAPVTFRQAWVFVAAHASRSARAAFRVWEGRFQRTTNAKKDGRDVLVPAASIFRVL